MARSRRTLGMAALAVVVVLGVAAFGGWWYFFRNDAPEEASIQAAAETLDQQGGKAAASTEADGTWTVDPSVGQFADFSGTWAGYRFDEQLVKLGAVTAVGRTPAVTGNMTVEGGKVTDVALKVDLTTLKSDKARRDKALHHRGLESDKYPMATFTLTEPIALPASADAAGKMSTTAAGMLTAHGVSKPVDVAVEAKVANGKIAVVGRAPLMMSQYGIKAPTGYSVLAIKDQGMFEFQIFFTKA
jgi:polyisoprenoid-binding protein YceI